MSLKQILQNSNDNAFKTISIDIKEINIKKFMINIKKLKKKIYLRIINIQLKWYYLCHSYIVNDFKNK